MTFVVLSFLGFLMSLPILIVGSVIMNGWVLRYLWGWFVVPIFHLPNLTVPEAMGLAMVVGFMTKSYPSPKPAVQKTQEQAHAESLPKVVPPTRVFAKAVGAMIGGTIGTMFAAPLTTLLIGWILHHFV